MHKWLNCYEAFLNSNCLPAFSKFRRLFFAYTVLKCNGPTIVNQHIWSSGALRGRRDLFQRRIRKNPWAWMPERIGQRSSSLKGLKHVGNNVHWSRLMAPVDNNGKANCLVQQQLGGITRLDWLNKSPARRAAANGLRAWMRIDRCVPCSVRVERSDALVP